MPWKLEQTDTQTYRLTDRKTDKQTDLQTNCQAVNFVEEAAKNDRWNNIPRYTHTAHLFFFPDFCYLW